MQTHRALEMHQEWWVIVAYRHTRPTLHENNRGGVSGNAAPLLIRRVQIRILSDFTLHFLAFFFVVH